jgi:hypothetical protein
MKIHCRVNLVVNPSSDLQLYFFFFTLPLSRQRPLSCCSWHGRNDFQLLINRTWKLLAKVFKWSPIVCLLLLTVMTNPEKYECGSFGLKYPNVGNSILPRGSGPVCGRFPEFHSLCGRIPTGGLAGMITLSNSNSDSSEVSSI